MNKLNINKLKNKMGYRDDSPFNQLPSIDIHTPTGLIDMSATGQPLIANGRYLPAYSGQHQFDTNVVTETPAMQNGGDITNCPEGYIYDFVLQDCVATNKSNKSNNESKNLASDTLNNLPIYTPDSRYADYMAAKEDWKWNLANVKTVIDKNNDEPGRYYGNNAPIPLYNPNAGKVVLNPSQYNKYDNKNQVETHEDLHAALDGRQNIPDWYADVINKTSKNPDSENYNVDHDQLFNERAVEIPMARKAIIDYYGLKPDSTISPELFNNYLKQGINSSKRPTHDQYYRDNTMPPFPNSVVEGITGSKSLPALNKSLNFQYQTGGKLIQEQLKNLNTSKMMKNFNKKYQTGGYTPRLVGEIPLPYINSGQFMNGQPIYHNPQSGIGQNNSQGNIPNNGPKASDAKWNAYLQTPAGIKWKQDQMAKTQSDDYVYMQPQTPVITPNIRDNFATRAGEKGWLNDANQHIAGRVMYPIRKTNDITKNGNGIYYDSDVYYQPMNGLGQDVGEGKVIANTDFNNRPDPRKAYPINDFNNYKYPVKPINPINTTNPTDIANVKPLKKGGYINKAGRYVHKDGVTTSKPGLWSNVYMKNKKELGGVIVPKYQLGTNNFNPVGSNILPGTNTAPDKSLCPPGFAFIGGQCLPLQSAPEANVTGTIGILPMAKTDYVTQRYNTDAKFAKKYDDSIDKYESDEEDKQDKLDSDKSDNRIALKMGVLGANAIAGIAGTMYDNNYRLKNARKIQADTEYNPSFSYGSNDYGVAKMGGVLKHFANGGNLSDFDFLYNEEDDKEDDAKRVTAEDIAAAKVKDDKYVAIAKENEQLKADAQNQQNSDLAMGIVNGDGYKRKMQQGNNELDYSGATGDIPTTGSGTMIGSKEYTNAWNQYANNNLGPGLNNVKAYYKSKGYEPEFISGVLGNIHAESNGRSNVNEVGGGGGYGLFQHTGVRRTQLVDYANSHNMNPADPIAQAMFAEQEPGFKNAYTAFQNSPDKSPGRAAVLFEKKFERAGIKRYDARIGAANSIYQTFKLGGEYEVSDVELQDLIRKGIQFQMI